MKTLFFLFMVCAICSVGASAQISGAVSAQPQPLIMPDHAEHASQVGLAASQNLMERSGGVSYQGERPLWEVAPSITAAVPLGDLAREARKEHASAKRAARVWTN